MHRKANNLHFKTIEAEVVVCYKVLPTGRPAITDKVLRLLMAFHSVLTSKCIYSGIVSSNAFFHFSTGHMCFKYVHEMTDYYKEYF